METENEKYLSERIFKLEKEIDKLNHKNEELENIFFHILSPILITKKISGEIIYANPYAQSQYEISEEELIGLNIDTFYTNNMQRDKIHECFNTKGMVRNLELNFKTFNNNIFTGLLSLIDISFNQEECFISIVSDISTQKELYNKLKQKSDICFDINTYDELTGLNNKKNFFEKGEMLFKFHKNENFPLSIFVINIDKLCDINEFYKKETGDIIIKMFTDKLKELCREHDLISRYNQNDFVVLLPNIKASDSEKLAKKLVKEVLKLTYLTDSGDKVRIYISIGISQYKEDKDIDSLYKRAKDAVNNAKKNGKAEIVTK